MRRVLMISPHFPPDSTAATHRVRLLAPHLPAHGWQPTVLTVDPRDYEGRLDPDLCRQRAVRRAASCGRGPGRRVRAARSAWATSAFAPFAGYGREPRRCSHANGSTPCSSRSTPRIPRCSARCSSGASRLRTCSTTRTRGSASGAGLPARCAGGRPDFKSRFSRVVAARLEPYALDRRRCGDGCVERDVRAGARADARRAAARARRIADRLGPPRFRVRRRVARPFRTMDSFTCRTSARCSRPASIRCTPF